MLSLIFEKSFLIRITIENKVFWKESSRWVREKANW